MLSSYRALRFATNGVASSNVLPYNRAMRVHFPRLTPDEAHRLTVASLHCTFPDRPDLMVWEASWMRDADGYYYLTLRIITIPPPDPDLLNRMSADVRKRFMEERYGRTDWRFDSIPATAFLPERG